MKDNQIKMEGEAMESTAQTIKPCDPAIKRRIVFTDWRFVNPGWFNWVDAKGNAHGTAESFGPGELFFRPDNSPYGIRIVAQNPKRVGPLIEPERRWETMNIQIQTVIYEDGRYRAWGLCNPLLPKILTKHFWSYFESEDGYVWKRPNLGTFEFEGSKDNNIILEAGWENRSVFVDPSAPSEERYKMVIGDRSEGVCGAVSPDGVHWTELSKPILKDPNDSLNIAYYDEQLCKYVLYHRKWVHGRRAIGRTESDNFRQFPPSEVILEGILADFPPSVDLYTNCKTTIPGASDLHLLFPAVYHRDIDIGSIAIAASQNGKFWHFLPGSPIMTPTPFGEWDGGWFTASPNLLELPDGNFALPYAASNLPHKYPRGKMRVKLGLALWPKGRIVALEASERGEFTMLPITPGGHRLHINAATERAGSILIEVADVPGRSFADAEPIIGDQYRKLVTWNGQSDLGYKEEEQIVLRFRMRKAKIFSLDFVD